MPASAREHFLHMSMCLFVRMVPRKGRKSHKNPPLRGRLVVVQEMMQVMVSERGGKLYSTDERYCIDNGAMIAWPGLLAFKHGQVTPFEETTCTQRFRTDDVLVTWRD